MNAHESPSGAANVDEEVRSPGTQLLAMVLACASLTLWFWLDFPWQHHNESLVWAVSLSKVSFWETLTSNPVPSVQNFRPLGVALAWVTFHLSSGGIWLQQLVNFALTALAWAMACTACRRQLTFAWLSLICGVAYFSGYIYLFHLHGVFYPPLFLFIAALLVYQSNAPTLRWRNALGGLATAVVAGLFHPFALLIFAAYVCGLWLECRINRRAARLDAAALATGAAVALAVVLTFSAQGLGESDPLEGLLASYRLLEANRIVSLVSVLLAVVTGSLQGRTRRMHFIGGAVAAVVAAAFMLTGLPVIFCWIAGCLVNVLRHRQMALAALIVACATIPLATGSGSPTYALFVLMPCIAAIADDLPLPGSQSMHRRAAVAAITITLALLVALRAGIALPVASKFIVPLLAEKEKTQQLMSAFTWLDDQPNLTGRLELCSAAMAPAADKSALDRTYRAPVHAWEFGEYVKARFGPRLASGRPLELCFGGQQLPDAETLYSLPGRWAGTASIQRPLRATAIS